VLKINKTKSDIFYTL